jgi:DNA-binding transcriptional regulator YdaS (Cro superfamily)
MNCTKPEAEAAREAVRVLGGPTKAARLLGVPKARHQTVQAWMRSRVPAEYCPDVEAETRARGAVVPCERLRPDVSWGRIRGAAAPATVASQHDAEKGCEAVHDGNVGVVASAVHQNATGAL